MIMSNTHRNGGIYNLNVPLFYKDFSSLQTEPLDLFLRDGFTARELFDLSVWCSMICCLLGFEQERSGKGGREGRRGKRVPVQVAHGSWLVVVVAIRC